jgi:hypothetical protein
MYEILDCVVEVSLVLRLFSLADAAHRRKSSAPPSKSLSKASIVVALRGPSRSAMRKRAVQLKTVNITLELQIRIKYRRRAGRCTPGGLS